MSTTSTMEWCSTRTDQDTVDTVTVRSGTAPLSDHQREAQTVRLLGYGDCIGPGEYILHSRFRRASNFLCGENLISIVDRTIGDGPFNLVVDGYNSLTGDRVLVRQDSIQIDDTQFICDGTLRYNSIIEILPHIESQRIQENLRLCKQILKDLAPSRSLAFLFDGPKYSNTENSFERVLQRRFFEGTRLITEDKVLEGVGILKGIGFGLTPSGDDLISGLLIALNVRKLIYRENLQSLIEDIFGVVKNSNPLSMAFIRSAKDGRPFEKLKRVIFSVFGSDSKELVRRMSDLLTVGATSGADIAVGLITGLSIGLEGEQRSHGH